MLEASLTKGFVAHYVQTTAYGCRAHVVACGLGRISVTAPEIQSNNLTLIMGCFCCLLPHAFLLVFVCNKEYNVSIKQ